MIDWHWPQYLFAALYVASVLSMTYRLGAKKSVKPPTPLGFCASLTIQAGLVYALHVGGFW